MVIDSSALIAILLQEPERGPFIDAISTADRCLLSTANYVETTLVIESRLGEEGGRELELLIAKAQIELVPISAEMAEVARTAWRKYGKGRHPASLNFGDCFSYALAKISGNSLLFKGNDFSQTDLVPA